MNFNFLSKTVLFRGMSEKDIECMLDCLAAKQQHFSYNIEVDSGTAAFLSVLSGHPAGELTVHYPL